MSLMPAVLDHPLAREVSWVLLHSLWQGALVGAAFALARHGLRGRAAQVRYLAGCLALAAMAAGPVATLWLWPAPGTPGAPLMAAAGAEGLLRPLASAGAAALPGREAGWWLFGPEAGLWWRLGPWVSAAWALGVAVCLLRLMRGCAWVRRARRCGTERVEPAWLGIVDDLRLRLEISRPVRLLRSALVEVPTVIGWLRPVILLPASALTGLTPEQLEAILAHELAHVRRFDYLVNACQCALETLMFYHPAVWWVSRCVREEREHCCDDLVVKVCSNRLAYARALAVLAESGLGAPGLAFAASGAPLLTRIRRLLGTGAETGPATARQLTGLGLLAASLPLILGGVWLMFASAAASFQASALVRFNPEAAGPTVRGGAPPGGNGAVGIYDPYLVRREAELVQSDAILGEVVDRLGLREAWGGHGPQGGKLARPEAVGLLRRRVSLRPLRNTSLMAIQAVSGKAQEAADLANATAEAYKEYRESRRKDLSDSGIQSLLSYNEKLRREIEEAQTNADRLRQRLNLSDLAATEYTGPLLTAESLKHINALRIESAAEFVRQEKVFSELTNLSLEKLAQTLPSAVQDHLLANLLEQKNLIDQRLIYMQNDLGPSNSDLVKVQAALADLDGKIQDRVYGTMKAMEAKVNALAMYLTNLDQEVVKAKQEDIEMAKRTQPYFDAKRKLEELLRFRALLDSKIAVETQAPPRAAWVELVDAAVPPARPLPPNRRPSAGALLGSGALMDVLGALLLRAHRGPGS